MRAPQHIAALLLLGTPLTALAGGRGERIAETALAAPIAEAMFPVEALPALPVSVLRLPAIARIAVVPRSVAELGADAPQPADPPSAVLTMVRQKAGDRFNTTDSSHPNDFALCYRLTGRTGLQVIPGDPTPANVKLPVTTFANNAGVTVGMTFRLGKR